MTDGSTRRPVGLRHGEHFEIVLKSPGTVRIKMLSTRASVFVEAPPGSEIGKPELEQPQSGEAESKRQKDNAV